MALVDYPSSSEDELTQPTTATTPTTSLKRKYSSSSLPPLPSKFHSSTPPPSAPAPSTTPVSTVGESVLHLMLKETGLVMFTSRYPSTAEHACLSHLISKVEAEIGEEAFEVQTFLTSELGAPLPLHISLSRPIGFLTGKKDEFLASIDRNLKKSGVRPFKVVFSSLDWVSNFESTRWFLVLRLRKAEADGLNKLLHVTNTTVQENGQPPLYASPTKPKATPTKRGKRPTTQTKTDWDAIPDLTDAFHFSIAWSLKAPSEEVKEATKKVMEEFGDGVRGIEVEVGEVKVKIGNVVTEIALLSGQVESGGLFGL